MVARWGALAVAVAILAGCQTAAEAPSTASGKPEVLIRAPVGKIKSLLISKALDRGLAVTKDSEYLLQLEKPTENMAAAVLLGSRYDATPNERYVVTFAQVGDEVRVVVAAMIVTNPGSAFERITPINSGDGVNRTQQTLLEIKQIAEEPPPKASPTPAPKPAARGAPKPSG